MADGSIRINTNIDTEDAQKDLKGLEKMCQRTGQNIKKISETWLNFGGNKGIIKAQTALSDLENKMKAVRAEISKTQAEINSGGYGEGFGKREATRYVQERQAALNVLEEQYKRLSAEIDRYSSEVQKSENLKTAGQELNIDNAGTAFISGIKNIEQYNAALSQTKNRMAEIEAAARKIAAEKGVDVNSLLKANSEYQKLNSRLIALNQNQGKFKNTTKMSFDGAEKAAKKLGDTLHSGIKTMAKYTLAIFGARSAFYAVKQAISSYISDNEALKNSVAGLKGVFSEILGPAIERVVNLIQTALSYVFAFIKALTGIDYVARYNAKALEKQTKATGALTQAQKANQRQSAGFDEQTKLNDTSSGSGGSIGGGGSNIATLDFNEGSLLEKFRAFGEKISKLWKEGDYFGIGTAFGDAINDSLELIDAKLIGQKLSNIISGAFDIAIGFFETVDWAKIGTKIINFIQGIDWVSLFSKAAKLMSSMAKGLGNLLTGAIEEVDWKNLPEKLYDILVGIVKSIDWSGIISTGYNLLGAAVGGAAGLLVGFWELVYDLFTNAWNSVKNYFGTFIKNAGGDIVKGIFDGILAAIKNIGTWIKENIFNPFLKGFKKAFGINSPSTVMKKQGNYIMDGLYKGIKEKIEKIKSVCKTILSAIKNVFKVIPDWFKTTFANAWTKVKNVFSSGSKVFSGIKEGIEKTFKSVVNTLISGINTVIAIPFNKINSTLNTIRNISILGKKPFANLWDYNPLSVPQIPRLAKGGIVNNPGRGVIATIGEAGAEAVVPLERNTEWIDMLSDKINGGTVVVPVYLDGKLLTRYVIDRNKKMQFATNGGVI